MAPALDAQPSANAPQAQVIYLCDEHGQLKTLEQIKHDAMAAALLAHANNITKAAAALGISKSTFYRQES
jgi:transcriptional regulator of acetoin/glycerol metabolism